VKTDHKKLAAGRSRTAIRLKLLDTIRMRAAASFVLIANAVVLPTASPAQAFVLVTLEEAALPQSGAPEPALSRSPTRRPSVTVVSPPAHAGMIHSPFDLKLRFHAFGGARIDPTTVIVTYLKDPRIDITQRITPFITADGIYISHAEVPPGRHQFWIELKDNDGRVGAGELSFGVSRD